MTAPHAPVPVDDRAYPWLRVAFAEVPTVQVTLPDGKEFLYGSIIGLNNSIEKLADAVPEPDSTSAQAALFAGLPDTLVGLPHQGISKVENAAGASSSTLFVASRNIVRYTGLVFAVEPPADRRELPVVLRVGISVPKEHFRLLKIMGITPTSGHRRRS